MFINEEERTEILSKIDNMELDEKYFRYKKEEKEILDTMPKNLDEAFTFLKKLSGKSFAKLASEVGVCEKTLQRLANKRGRKVDYRTLTLICLRMNLYPLVSIELFGMSSVNLYDGSLKSNIIKELLFSRKVPNLSEIEKAFSAI